MKQRAPIHTVPKVHFIPKKGNLELKCECLSKHSQAKTLYGILIGMYIAISCQNAKDLVYT